MNKWTDLGKTTYLPISQNAVNKNGPGNNVHGFSTLSSRETRLHSFNGHEQQIRHIHLLQVLLIVYVASRGNLQPALSSIEKTVGSSQLAFLSAPSSVQN
jgi:hypothetical protein